MRFEILLPLAILLAASFGLVLTLLSSDGPRLPDGVLNAGLAMLGGWSLWRALRDTVSNSAWDVAFAIAATGLMLLGAILRIRYVRHMAKKP
jgi:hypothetical protein